MTVTPKGGFPKAPEFVLLKASAGSGKTHALSLRYLEFLLAPARGAGRGPALRDILAITFTKNAAREMKTRILDWLKEACLGDGERIAELEKAGVPAGDLPARAGEAVERILSGYTDFQVETIDSFMASVFKASAVDLGYPPDFEIVLEPAELIDYAFFRYLRNVREKSADAAVFRRILDYLLLYQKEDAAFAWDPTAQVLERLIEFYGRLTAQSGDLVIEELDEATAKIVKRIAVSCAALEESIEDSGLEKNPRGHCFSRILPAVKEKRFSDLISASFKTLPVKKPAGKEKAGGAPPPYDLVTNRWRRLEARVRDFGSLYARDFFSPYLLAYRSLSGTLDRVKRREGVVFIADMNRQLARYLDAGIVPDVYFRLGDRIAHYLVDEFQDTSPIQWKALRPLIEESLSRGGSLFVVGDTKQAIYGFRDADYRIMRRLEEGREEFPSAVLRIAELKRNYRSGEAILDFVKKVFLENTDEEFRGIARLSGLDEFRQEPVQKNLGQGYVEYALLEKGAGEGPAEETPEEGEEAADSEAPEKARLQSLVRELRGRGYAYSDLAVLTYKNESVVAVSAWLNEIDVPFIPFSSLDIRGRKVIGEILALLRFLDSPPDDLSFASFLLGDVFAAAAGSGREWRDFLFERRRANEKPLYTAFRKRHAGLWDRFFEPLFKAVGYYPLYDLATAVYRAFDLFAAFPGEEAALAKFLEAIKDFEGMGRNDLREFLAYTGEGGGEGWTIDVPAALDAVRVMTIHKAKGLGFPVVILLLYGDRWKAPGFYVDAQPSGDEGAPEQVRVYKINKELAESDAELKRIYEESKQKDAVNRLNTLYVALTRARAELYVVGVKGPRDKFPFDALNVESPAPIEAEPGTTPAARLVYRSAASRPPAWRGVEAAESERAPTRRPAGPFEVPPNPRETLNSANIRRGELAHRILAGVEFIERSWDEELREVARSLRPAESEAPLYEEVARSIARSLDGSPVAGYFAARPGRRVFRELTFCDAEGRAFRVDRLVVDPEAVQILDYKTGAEKAGGRPEAARARLTEADKDQVRTYIRIVADVYPGRPVRGILAYIDQRRWEIVE